MKNLVVFLSAILILIAGCNESFFDKSKDSEKKTEAKQDQTTDTKKEGEVSDLTKKEEELKRKELELKEEELKLKEEELQKRKETPVEPPTTKKKSYKSNYDIHGDYPEASIRYLTYSDIYGKSKWELGVMRNEIYARHGYIFRKNISIRNHFLRQSWYYPQYYNVDHLLSDIEKYNIAFIKSYE